MYNISKKGFAMTKLLVIAGLMIVNLLTISPVFGNSLIKKELDRSSKLSFEHDDPPVGGW